MSGLQNLSLEQAAVLIASSVCVKQAVDSTAKPAYSQAVRQPPTQGGSGIMDRVRAALGNIDFGSLANRGMDAAKGFSPGSNPLHAALLGGGLGMGVGALGSLTSSDKEKRKRWLQNALFGGAMGGIGGAGFGAVMNYGNKLVTDQSAREQAELNRPQEPTLADRASHAATNPTATVVGGLAGGVVGHTAGKMYDRHKDNKALAGVLGTKGFSTHLTAANAAMQRAGVPPITQAQIDQAGRYSTAMPWQKLLGGSGSPAKAPAAGAAGPVQPAGPRLSYRKPQLLPEQTGPLVQQYKDYMSKAKSPPVTKRPFGLSGMGGTVLGAGLGAALTAAGTPHLSLAQKQQQAATLPTLQ